MAKRRSLRNRIKSHNDSFVGREKQINTFLDNLKLGVDHNSFKNIFNISGAGGMGKTTLVKKYEEYALEHGMKTVYVDFEDTNLYPVPSVMDYIADQLEDSKKSFKPFSKKYKDYFEKKSKFSSQLNPNSTMVESIASDTVKLGMSAAAELIPGGGIVKDFLPVDTMAEGTGKLVNLAWSKFGNNDDVELVLQPQKILSPMWLEGLYDFTENNSVCLIFDNYETSNPKFDIWLEKLMAFEFGEDVPYNLLILISGRKSLDASRWSKHKDLMRRITLHPFSDAEAIQYLNDNGITDKKTVTKILEISGNLPVFLSLFVLENSTEVIDHASLPTEKVVKHFLRRIENPRKREIARLGAIPRYLNLDITRRLLKDPKPSESQRLYDWLKQSIVQKRGGKWTYHPIIRQQMINFIQEDSNEDWTRINLAIADYYDSLGNALGFNDDKEARKSDKWLEYRLEYHYHSLCAHRHGHLSEFFKDFIESLSYNLQNLEVFKAWLEGFRHANSIEINSDWDKSLEMGLETMIKRENDKGEKFFKKLISSKWFDEDEELLAWLHHLVGWCYNITEKVDLSIKYYHKAIAICPEKRSWSYGNLAGIYEDQENWELAEKNFLKALEFEHDDRLEFLNRYTGFLYRQKRYEEGIKYGTEAIKINSKDYSSNELLGLNYFYTNEYKLAIKYFKQTVGMDPLNSRPYRNLAISYERVDKKKKVISTYKKYVKNNPTDIMSHYYLSEAYKKQDKFEQATKVYEDYLENYADHAKILNWLANLLVNTRKEELRERGIKLYKRGIIASPEYWLSYYNLGIAYYNSEEYDEAYEYLEQSAAFNKDHLESWQFMAEIDRIREEYDKAKKHFKKTLDLSPKHYFSNYKLGLVLKNLESEKSAIKHYKAFIDADPENHADHIKLVRNLRDLEEFELGKKVVEHLIKTHPKHIDYYIEAGKVYNKAKDYKNVLKSYKKATEIDPDSALAWLALGEYYYDKDQFDDAKPCYEKASELNNTMEGPNHKLGVISNIERKYEEAIGFFEKEIELAPKKAFHYGDLGLVYIRKKDFKTALKLMDKVSELAPDYAATYLVKSFLYFKLNKPDQVEEELNNAKERFKDDVTTFEKLGRLYLENLELDQAEIYLEQAWNISEKTHKDTAMGMALLFVVKKAKKKALTWFKHTLSLSPNKDTFLIDASQRFKEMRIELDDDIPSVVYFNDLINTVLDSKK